MLNPWFVTGFCDGEAIFTFSKAGESFNLYFTIRQKEKNSPVVRELQSFFNGIGTIYKKKQLDSSTRNETETPPWVFYRVAKVDELKIIIDHFDKYPLQSKKQESYNIWRQMAMHKIENYRDTNFNMLKALAGQLVSLNQRKKDFSCITS